MKTAKKHRPFTETTTWGYEILRALSAIENERNDRRIWWELRQIDILGYRPLNNVLGSLRDFYSNAKTKFYKSSILLKSERVFFVINEKRKKKNNTKKALTSCDVEMLKEMFNFGRKKNCFYR